MNYKLWDGKESINGVGPETIKAKHGDKKLALFYTVEGVIERIEDLDILRSVYGLTDEKYIEICEEASKVKPEEVTNETLNKKLDQILEILSQKNEA